MKKRADGRYCKQILIGYTSEGKRKVKNIYGKTIKEVEKQEREIRDNIENGISLMQENITLEEWSIQWLEVYKNNVSKSTYDMYQGSVKNHIIPNIGNIPVSKLKPIQIQRVLNNLLNTGRTRTAEIFKLTMKQIIAQAVYENIIPKNICENLEKIKNDRIEKRPLTDFEIKCIQNTQYTKKEKLFLDILYYTGIRRGEALALTVGSIDKKNKKLKITNSLDIRENQSELRLPKTKSGQREIPIPELLYNDILEYIKTTKTFYLFPNQKGELSTRSSFRRMWDSIIRKTKQTAEYIINDEVNKNLFQMNEDKKISFTPHIFRHTYATNLYYAGIDVKKCQYLLGHSSIEMTLKIYTHLDSKRNDKEDFDKINDFFSQSKVSQTEKIG